MKAFEEIATTLQVGLRRSALPKVDILTEWQEQVPERRALVLSGALGLMRRAGAAPRTGIAAIPAAPSSSERLATSSLAPLADALANGPVEAILEWAEKAGRLGRVAPHGVLARLLPLAQKHPEALVPILGVQGEWLAELQGIALETDGEVIDARALLESACDSMDWKERAASIRELAHGLSPSDEPVLTKALEDRRKEVREAAADLVFRLEQSAPALALRSLAEGLLSLEKSLLRRALVVNPPEPGTVPKWLPRTHSRQDFGPKALALLDILRYTPPGRWKSDVSQETFLDLAVKTEYAGAIVDGLAEAAVRFGDQEWVDTFFAFSFTTDKRRPDNWEDLCRAASVEAFERIVGSNLTGFGANLPIALWAITRRKRLLSPSLSRAIVKALRSNSGNHFTLRELAVFLDPSSADLLSEPSDDEYAESTRKAVHRTLDLRRRLLASLDQ